MFSRGNHAPVGVSCRNKRAETHLEHASQHVHFPDFKALHAKARLLNERVLLMGVLVHLLPLDKACTKRKEQKAILESLHSDMMPQALGSRDVQ